MNSSLDPEAPEFFPHLTSQTKDGFQGMSKTIRISNSFPSGAGYSLFKTITDFSVLTQKFSENVLLQAEKIVATELPNVKLKCNDKEYNQEKIMEANDCLVDRVHINIDTITGVNKPDEKFLEGVNPRVAGWNRMTRPQVEKIEFGAATLFGGRNIPRPQLLFKDPIDNSGKLWVPIIKEKPNNIKPLALVLERNFSGQPVGYEHPYKEELDIYSPAPHLLKSDPVQPVTPLSLRLTQYTYVDTVEKLDQLIAHLREVDEIAFDLEHHSYRTYQGITCLIQITTEEGGDYIIDALALREHLHKLNLAFTDPKILKVAHGAQCDILWLQRDFGVYVVGLFDTYHAAKLLNEKGCSYKFLLMKYCGIDTNKRYQLADWRIRPLPHVLVEYARIDTHYLLYIYKRMKDALIRKTKLTLIKAVYEHSRQTCCATYSKPVVDDKTHLNLYAKSGKTFNNRQMVAMQMLYKWRDTTARELDESTAYVLPNHMLLNLAETLPREVQGVVACCLPTPPIVNQNLLIIHRMILTSCELPLEPPLYQLDQVLGSARTMPAPVQVQPGTSGTHDLTGLQDTTQNQPEEPEEEVNVDIMSDDSDDGSAHSIHSAITVFLEQKTDNSSSDSDVSVGVEGFVPPYERYTAYRGVAQMEELKDLKVMELSQGDENEELKDWKVMESSQGDEVIKEKAVVQLHYTIGTFKSDLVAAGFLTSTSTEDDEPSTSTGNNPAPRSRAASVSRSRTSSLSTLTPPSTDSEESPDSPNKTATERKRKAPTPNKNKFQNSDYSNFRYKSGDYEPKKKPPYDKD